MTDYYVTDYTTALSTSLNYRFYFEVSALKLINPHPETDLTSKEGLRAERRRQRRILTELADEATSGMEAKAALELRDDLAMRGLGVWRIPA